MEKQVDPLVSRATDLNEYSASDLSVEEQLAGGASVDNLIAAGVLYDDYDPDNDPAYSFTPLPTEEEMAAQRAAIPEGPPISDAEFQEQMREYSKYDKMAAEHRKEANRSATWT